MLDMFVFVRSIFITLACAKAKKSNQKEIYPNLHTSAYTDFLFKLGNIMKPSSTVYMMQATI